MIVKVCGVTKGEQFNWLDEHDVDMIGLNFYPASKRYVGQFLKGMNTVSRTINVGIFVNQDLSYILETIAEYNLAIVQLHGNESPAFCNEVARHIPIIKAFGIEDDFSFADTEPFLASADYFLFDTKSATYGGSGKKFNWQKLAEYSFDTPFLLSGGICLNDILAITNLKHKALAGIDVNSGFEIGPGDKDLKKINTMLKLIESNVSR
jgi:phosphoribosylanthranilate isomerase